MNLWLCKIDEEVEAGASTEQRHTKKAAPPKRYCFVFLTLRYFPVFRKSFAQAPGLPEVIVDLIQDSGP